MRFVIGFVASLAAGLASAATPIKGVYSSIFGGYTYLPNNVNHTNYAGLTVSNASYWSGFDAGGSLGYKSNPMRYEGELTYLQANVKKFNVNSSQQTGVTGYSNAIFAMANVYYDFPNWFDTLSPFLGGGIGYGWVSAHLNGTGPIGYTQFRGSNCRFSYQGTAGITYNFSENYALNIGYRYIATVNSNQLGKFFQANLASVGAVYRFDEGRYK